MFVVHGAHSVEYDHIALECQPLHLSRRDLTSPYQVDVDNLWFWRCGQGVAIHHFPGFRVVEVAVIGDDVVIVDFVSDLA